MTIKDALNTNEFTSFDNIKNMFNGVREYVKLTNTDDMRQGTATVLKNIEGMRSVAKLIRNNQDHAEKLRKLENLQSPDDEVNARAKQIWKYMRVIGVVYYKVPTILYFSYHFVIGLIKSVIVACNKIYDFFAEIAECCNKLQDGNKSDNDSNTNNNDNDNGNNNDNGKQNTSNKPARPINRPNSPNPGRNTPNRRVPNNPKNPRNRQYSYMSDNDEISYSGIENYTKLFIHNGYYPGTEGFYDSALRLLTGVSNIVYRTLTNAKIVYRAFRGLKRTEIHSYQDRYAATIFRVKKLSYPEVSEVMIPRPKGLSTTYLEVTNALIACLNTCDMVNRAKSFAHASKSVMEQITDGAAPTAIAGIMGNHDNEIRQITGLYEKASACLSDKGMGAIPFGKGFSSMDEYSSVQKLLDDNCKFEYDATKVYGYLEDCTANMDKVIQSVKSIKNGNIIIGKNDITNLSDTCLLMAKTFDVYGLCIQDFNRVEHNFVEATKTVVNHFKL